MGYTWLYWLVQDCVFFEVNRLAAACAPEVTSQERSGISQKSTTGVATRAEKRTVARLPDMGPLCDTTERALNGSSKTTRIFTSMTITDRKTMSPSQLSGLGTTASNPGGIPRGYSTARPIRARLPAAESLNQHARLAGDDKAQALYP